MTAQKNKVKDILCWLAVGLLAIIVVVLCIVSRINKNRVENIISRYDGYLETVDSLASGCSSLPTNIKGFAEEILNMENIDTYDIDFESCKKFLDISPAYFAEMKDNIRQMAFDRYYEETKTSLLYVIADTIQCLIGECPVRKISTHYHL